jgi:cobyrinic acid a,c-diamide synthase
MVGSDGHEALLREALDALGVPVLGALRRDDKLRWRDRHLGLVPVAERPAEVGASLDRLAELVAEQIDLEAVTAIARAAPPSVAPDVALPPPGAPAKVGVASGRAFTFTYTDTVDALVAAGAEVIPFDPLSDCTLPDGIDGLIVGGGFPEVHAAELAANETLLADLAARVGAGLPTWAECGGLLLLTRELDGHRMADVVPATATLTGRLTLGYRSALTRVETPIGPIGTGLRGHEFHYSTVEPAGDAVDLESRWGRRTDGYATPDLLATYLHYHPGGDPGPIAAFVSRCALRSALRRA